jgi:RNA polymerase sigma-70 factor (ECF subfamily)
MMGLKTTTEAAAAVSDGQRDQDNRRWLGALRASGRDNEQAIADLHQLLVRAARFEVQRRSRALLLSPSAELDDLALQAADDALVAILARLDSFQGRSAFTTWAYKFAIHIAGVSVRKHVWRSRQIPTSDDALAQFHSDVGVPERSAEQYDLLQVIGRGISSLTTRQREVLLALCVSDVPIDVLADRLGSTRGAIYKTLHDARSALRRHLAEEGIDHV